MKGIAVIVCAYLVLMGALLVSCYPHPQAPQRTPRYFEKSENGDRYRYGYSTRNGDQVQQEAEVKLGPVLEDGTQEAIPVIRGSYSFVDNFGKKHEVRYEADENGFRVLE